MLRLNYVYRNFLLGARIYPDGVGGEKSMIVFFLNFYGIFLAFLANFSAKKRLCLKYKFQQKKLP